MPVGLGGTLPEGLIFPKNIRFQNISSEHHAQSLILKSALHIGQTQVKPWEYTSVMIIGTHFLLYSKNPDADRAFFRDVLKFPFVDAGEGWLIFGMSPAEAGIHPMEGEFTQDHAGHPLLGAVLYLMCDDLDEMMASFKVKNIECSEIQAAGWGRVTTIPLPSGGRIGMYQPRHATALNLRSK